MLCRGPKMVTATRTARRAFRRNSPSPPICSAACPRSARSSATWSAAARPRPDGCAAGAWKTPARRSAGCPDTSRRRPATRIPSGSRASAPFQDFFRCKCPAAGGNSAAGPRRSSPGRAFRGSSAPD